MELPHRNAELVQIVDASFADAAARSGPWLLCGTGCNQCCYGAFAINALDAVRLRVGMEALQVGKPDLAERIEGRARAWIERYGANFPGDLPSGVLGKSDEELERFEEFANHAPCPALDPATGLCDVYPWRPMTCRVFGPPVRMGDGDALGHCELCFKGATDAEVAACEMTVPHDLEESLVEALGDSSETVVAFALLRAAICERSVNSPR